MNNDDAETHEDADAPEEAPRAPVIRELELRPHPKATHWAIARATADDWERLAFRTTDAGEAIHYAPVETFSATFVRTMFGPGHYRVNWREIPSDSRRNNTLGNDELVLVAYPSEGGARAPSVPLMSCQACGAELAGRFCAQCGAPAGARAVAPSSNAEFKDGVAFTMQAIKSTAEQTRAEADERIKRYEIDVKATLERERMAHDKALAEQAAWFERLNAGPKFDPNVLVEKFGALVKEEMSGLEARLAELEERLEEEEEDEDETEEPEAPPPATPEGATWNDRIEAAGKFVDKVGAPMVNAIGDVVDRIRKNGVAGAESGQPT